MACELCGEEAIRMTDAFLFPNRFSCVGRKNCQTFQVSLSKSDFARHALMHRHVWLCQGQVPHKIRARFHQSDTGMLPPPEQEEFVAFAWDVSMFVSYCYCVQLLQTQKAATFSMNTIAELGSNILFSTRHEPHAGSG